MFDKNVFESALDKGVKALAVSEKTTKDTLRELSRSVCEAVHATGNIGYVNQLIAVLSPVNRKVAVLFFKHFVGFSYDDNALMFTTKSKKRYDAAHAECMKWLEDPHNNIWTWADRHVQHEVKPKTIQDFNKYLTNFLNKTQGAINRVDILRAVFDHKFTAEEIAQALQESKIEGLEVNDKE